MERRIVQDQRPVVVIGGGVVGTSVLFALTRVGISGVLLEEQSDLALSASATNSGALHTGFDSPSGELETELILRSARLRTEVVTELGIPVLRCGALVTPRDADEAATVQRLAVNAARNGVEVRLGSDGALEIPGEAITDPVVYTLTLAASATAAGARIERNAAVVGIDQLATGLVVRTAAGQEIRADVVINCAGLYADRIARFVGDSSFEIYPRKGEFLVFRLGDQDALDRILLPVPTPSTKGVLVFPTLDGHVVAGPTAVDQRDKEDWSVRAGAADQILDRAIERFPALKRADLVATYAGLRPAGRDRNYVIGPSAVEPRLINVAAIRSTGLSASLGIADYVLGFLPSLGISVDAVQPPVTARPSAAEEPWWTRTVHHRSLVAG